MLYYPYPANDGKHKYYVYTRSGRKIFFGDIKYEDYTIHKDPKRKQRYIDRHKKREDWSNPDTPAFWSRWLLWEKPTLKSAYENIINNLLKL